MYIIKRIKAWHYRRKIIQAATMLYLLDKVMIRAGYDRAIRRRFWKAMHTNRDEVIKVLNEIALSTRK